MAKLVLALRYIAVFALLVAILLIILRAKFPVEDRSKGTIAYWREVWSRLREWRMVRKERTADLKAIKGKTALLVDPDNKSLKVMSWRLESLKSRILQASSGRKGLILASRNVIDYAIVDALLTDTAARDFYHSLGRPDIPVIFVGVLDNQYDELRHLGPNTKCFGKPYDPDEVAALAGYMLRNNKET